MEIAYVFHAKACALLVDDGGICRWVVLKAEDDAPAAERARRCIGAQFVATLDPAREGMLGPDPEIGKSMLFARVDEGRIALVRFGPLVSVERVDAHAGPAPSPPREEPVPATVPSLPHVPPTRESDANTVERPTPQATLESLVEVALDDVVTSVAVETEGPTSPFTRSDPPPPPPPRLRKSRPGAVPRTRYN
jgi:hypothetical protein